jgi:peptidoglycan hydrolase CwlO-like protein
MTLFAEKMKAYTDDVAVCAQERATTLAGLSEFTERFLSDTRSFMKGLNREHQAMATRVRSTLTADRQDRARQVKGMRQDICNQLQDMQKQLQETLSHSRSSRQECLGQLFTGFREARQQLAGDLREASRIWRGRKHR